MLAIIKKFQKMQADSFLTNSAKQLSQSGYHSKTTENHGLLSYTISSLYISFKD